MNVNDYISKGHNRSAYTGEFQPRLGFSLDINADQRHVIFGGYGRSYDRDLYNYLQLETTKAALPEYTVYFPNAGGTTPGGCFGSPCVAWNPAYLTSLSNLQALVGSSNAGAEVDAINNNLKVPYSDQFSIGIRNKLGDWKTRPRSHEFQQKRLHLYARQPLSERRIFHERRSALGQSRAGLW